jgi:hypothetical protein
MCTELRLNCWITSLCLFVRLYFCISHCLDPLMCCISGSLCFTCVAPSWFFGQNYPFCHLYYILCHLYFILCQLYFILFHLYFILFHLYLILCHLYFVLCHLYYFLNHLHSSIHFLLQENNDKGRCNFIFFITRGKQARIHIFFKFFTNVL